MYVGCTFRESIISFLLMSIKRIMHKQKIVYLVKLLVVILLVILIGKY